MIVMMIPLIIGCNGGAEESSEKNTTVMMATTTSVEDTGLLKYLQKIFKEDTGYTLEYIAVGTGAALEMGKNGDVDIVFVHARTSEEEFVAEGYGVERIPVMYNDFVIVGPTDKIEKIDDVEVFFSKIAEEEFTFISRGDDSGTHKKEVEIWEQLGIDPTTNSNYLESGQGMGATLTMANEEEAYTLTDRGTWLKMSIDADIPMEIGIVCEGDENLSNQYGIIAISPDMYEDTNIEGANAFINWIVSEEIQTLLAEFGVDLYGQPLFMPNAEIDN